MSYRDLKSYQSATIIYDFTVEFCELYVKPDSTNQANRSNRMVDQMVQAARSGKQNIVEASTERTSSQLELKLLGVSRASFEELLHDYEDYLRQRKLPKWDMNAVQAKTVRALPYRTDWSYQSYQSYLPNAANAANAMLCLINQCNYLLDRQIKSLEARFEKEGGWSERMRHRRMEEKKRRMGGPASWVRDG